MQSVLILNFCLGFCSLDIIYSLFLWLLLPQFPHQHFACGHARKVASVVSNSLLPYGLQSSRLLCPWDSPGKHSGVGCRPSFRGSSTKGSNMSLWNILHWQADFLPLVPTRKPTFCLVLYYFSIYFCFPMLIWLLGYSYLTNTDLLSPHKNKTGQKMNQQ